MQTTELKGNSNPLHVRFGDFEVDELNASLIKSGRSIALPPIPFRVLCVLLQHSGTLLSKHALLDHVWGHRFVSDSVLKGAISDVRRALNDDSRQPRYIETLPRRGYRFIAPIKPFQVDKIIAINYKNKNLQSHAMPMNDDEHEDSIASLFIGRKAQLTKLKQAWDCTLQGNRAIVWVAGEPGIGKTTLIEHFATGLKGVITIHGQCVQHYGAGEPYLPVLEAISELCRLDPTAVTLLHDVAPTWLLQLPWLSSTEQRAALLHELVGVNPQRMLREMGEFVERYTELQPLLLITEDLHWADQSTIQLIDYMARKRSRRRLMWLSSFRLTEIIALDHPLNTIRHELKSLALSDEILLDSFSESEVAEYMTARAAVMDPNEQFMQALYEQTSGVPLFVAAVINDVLDKNKQIKLIDPLIVATTTVPETLGSLIDHHITKLSQKQKELLSVAAVAGMGLRLEIISHVLKWNMAEMGKIGDKLVEGRTWLILAKQANMTDRIEYAYEFRHALYRQRLYESLNLSSRIELHCKIGHAFEELRIQGLNVTAAEIASHYELGRSPLKALHYYAEAAQAALLHLSPSECMSLTGKALEIASRTPLSKERMSLEITLSTLRGVAAFHTLGAGDEAKGAYQHAVELISEFPEHPMTGLALYGFGFLLYLRAEYTTALAIAEQALALSTNNNNSLLFITACIVKGQVMAIRGYHIQALEALEKALPALELMGPHLEKTPFGFIVDPQVTVRTMLGLVLSQLGRFGDAREQMQQAYLRARQLAQPIALMLTIWCDALCRIRLGDTARVAALAKEMQSLVDLHSLAQGKAACHWFLGWTDAHFGKPHEGALRIRDAYDDHLKLGMIAGSSETLGYAAEAFILDGDWKNAQEQLEQAFTIVNSYGERIYLPQLLLIQANIAHLRADVDVEVISLKRAIAEARSQNAAWLELLALTKLCECPIHKTQDLSELNLLVKTLRSSGEESEPRYLSLIEQAYNLIRNI